MKVKLKSSWTNPINGKILPENSVIDIDKGFFNKAYHEEVIKKVKTPKKDK
jgi:hypothetical protein